MKVLFLSLLLLASPSFAWELQPHDCESATSYMTNNAKAIAFFGKSLLPILVAQDSWLPTMKTVSDVSYIGLGIGMLKGFLQLGGSPLGAANLFLNLMCLEIQRDSPVVVLDEHMVIDKKVLRDLKLIPEGEDL